MRILTLTNLYPPRVIGGYEELCREAVDWLAARGHQVHVVTSASEDGAEAPSEGVHRVLALDSPLEGYAAWRTWTHRRQTRRNARLLRALLAELRPDLLFVWGMWNLSRDLVAEVETARSVPVVYYLASPWPDEPSPLAAYWDDPAARPLRRLPKRLGARLARAAVAAAWHPPALRFAHAMCNTASLRDQLERAGHPLAGAALVCEGIDLAPYRDAAPRPRRAAEPLEVVFVGRLGHHKGAHTAVEAMAELVRRGRRDIRLTLCGGGLAEYKQLLRDLVAVHELAPCVTFQSPLPRAALPAFLARFHALVLPSIWPEALARIMQEGMAAALAVVATPTGATAEFLAHGENALLFPPGDGGALADQLARLADAPALAADLARAGRELALRRFDFARMMTEMEAYLLRVAGVGTGA